MATKAQINNFIAMIAPIAIRQAKKHDNKIYASVCIAQACHESGYGTSAKMVNANALFGIKVGKSAYHFGTAWKGKAYKTGTTEYYDGKTATKITDWFRAYDTVEDATEDYFDMLCTCSRYKPALNQPNPDACIRAIVKGGYATGPSYADHIMKVINTYNLTQYDNGSVPVTTPSIRDYKVGKTYKTNVDLYVRISPRGEKKPYNDLSLNAKANGVADNDGFGILRKDTKVTCKAIIKLNGQVWMQIPSGWICAINTNDRIYVD